MRCKRPILPAAMHKKLIALLALGCANAIELFDTLGAPLTRISPSEGDSNYAAVVRAPGVTETLYPFAARTPVDDYFARWFSGDRFANATIAPGQEGLITGNDVPGRYELVWQTAAGEEHAIAVELTCSDGIHCNGEERFVRGACVAGYMPYKFDIQQHECYEHPPWLNPEDPNRNRDCGPVCRPQCNQGRKCGSGGCPLCVNGILDNPPGCVLDADFCGACGVNETCVDGACEITPPPSTAPGTCFNPHPLFANDLSPFYLPGDGSDPAIQATTPTQIYVPANPILVPNEGIVGRLIINDVSSAENNIQPACNLVSNSPELLFEFEITEPRGFEIMVTGHDGVDIYNGYTGTMDALVAIVNTSATGCADLKPKSGADKLCSDDETPPGSLGSRAYGLLNPGRYNVVVSTYAASAWGPVIVWVKFPGINAMPSCAGKFCGSDSAGGRCGMSAHLGLPECVAAGDTCVLGRCSNCDAAYVNSSAYQSSCQGNNCGFDQCNQPCGNKGGGCGDGKQVCDELQKKCKPTTPCDHYAPVCKGEQNGNGPAKYCGSDCEWHRVDEFLPDLIAPQEEEIKRSIVFAKKSFDGGHCGVQENTITADPSVPTEETFVRRLMFFDTNVHNVGESFVPPPTDKAANLFKYGECHNHMHFEQFAFFYLSAPDGTIVSDVRSSKLAYCMEDSEPYLKGDEVPCAGTRTCDAQGLTRGYSDYYPADLDGQWIDLDNPYFTINPGWYRYTVEANFARVFHERDFTNNRNDIWVFINASLIEDDTVAYSVALEMSNGCAQLPAGVQVPECF